MAASMMSVLLIGFGVVLMLVLQILAILWVLSRGTTLLGASRLGERAEGLTAAELGELPCHDLKAAGGGTGGECAVCLETLQAGERCRVLPTCEHGFHAQCVDSWLRKSRLCPVCRADVISRGKPAGTVADEAAASEVNAERLGGADR